MLYDDFINADLNHYPEPGMVPGIRHFRDILKIAPKYSLSADVVQMVETLSWKRPKAILQGLPICFLPFPKIWVEFVYQDFKDAVDRVKNEHELKEMKGAPPPSRMGFLLEQVNDGSISATMGWIHRNIDTDLGFFRELLHLCPVAWIIATGKEYEPVPESVSRVEVNKSIMDKNGYMWEFRNSPADIEAYKELTTRAYPGVTRFSESFYHTVIERMDPVSKAQYDRLIQFDVGGEWRHVLAILMILNSKTCVEYDTVKREKLSKNRVKAGKPPVDDYKEVKFKLSRVQYNAYVASGRKMEDLTKHLVAAHLKVRKTGVFLWSAHVRGYVGEVKIPKRMVVP
jgi:hypothetical protein